MPREVPDFSRRAQLAELMDEPCSREELRACLRDLAKVNRWLLGYRPLLRWLEALGLDGVQRPVRVLDVGCGYGDGLRRIEEWARARGIPVELTGIDLNADSVAIAAEASGPGCRVEWVQADVFAYEAEKPIDLVMSSLFTHHLSDADVVRFVQWMEAKARRGWCVNDLSRAAIPYHLFRIFSRGMGLHPFVQHDGPVSIRRAFVAEEWQRLCAAAGLRPQDVTIRGFTPARLCVMRRKA
ncbi:MAG TPA: methyltransferase domain-containing protein [Terracidiphilus sp.]|nr:methyltransferase domain-containing protein [Terracidiphilus sp.]